MEQIGNHLLPHQQDKRKKVKELLLLLEMGGTYETWKAKYNIKTQEEAEAANRQ